MSAELEDIHEECGIFGVWGHPDASRLTYFGLHALQHRGQEGAGIVSNDNGHLIGHRGLGLLTQVFGDEREIERLKGNCAIGHVRYATAGSGTTDNIQPFIFRFHDGDVALCHNGNLVNARELREELELGGAIFHTTSDTEVIAYIITQERLRCESIEQAVLRAMERIEGAYSLVIMSPQKLIAARDPHGFRPLCMGDLDGDVVFASESCALDAIGATFVRDIEPGETVVVSAEGIKSLRCGRKCDSSLCVFEFIYFARPDSVVDGSSVHVARLRAGAFLALDHPVQADVVIGVPDSGIDAAIGYARQSGIPYGIGFIKNKYIGRTFIQPSQKQRQHSVRIKLNAVRSTVEGKRVVLIDDSIVRGTTSAHIVSLLREAGATEVHMRLTAPPFRFPCYFGTDIDSTDNLIAAHHSVEEIAKIIGVDSLGFLNVEHLPKLADHSTCGFCNGCFTGNYPVDPPRDTAKLKFERSLTERQQTEEGNL